MTDKTPEIEQPIAASADLAGKDAAQTDKTAEKTDNIDKTSVGMKFFKSGEGRIFVVGCCMIGLWLVTIAVLLHRGHAMWSQMLTMGFAHMLAGRAASIAQGTQAGMPSALIAVLATYTDVMVMFIVYPTLVFSYKHLFERPFFKKHMKPVFEAAQKKMTRLRRFEIVGVFLFVWFPFWMTGIIMGAVLGFLLGLRTWVNMTTVILGTLSAVIGWVYAYDALYTWGGRIHHAVPVTLTILIIFGLLAYRVLSRWRRASDRCGAES